jgi:hypothetical protein
MHPLPFLRTEPDTDLMKRVYEESDRFPASSEESTMLYDHYKLLEILQRKEMDRLLGDGSVTDRCLRISEQFGRLTPLFTRNAEGALGELSKVESIAGSELEGEAYDYAIQWGHSLKALYYYRKGDFEGAQALTLQCLSVNESLLNKGISCLLFRCLEQNRNISRICFRKGLKEDGAVLARAILDYMLSGNSGPLFGTIFTRETWNATPYVREGYTYSYFRGLVYYMIDDRTTEEEKRDLFHILFGGLEFSTNTVDRLILYNWVYIKGKEVERRYDEFLNGFLEFMQEPICKIYDILKVSLYFDVRRMVEKSDYDDKDRLLKKIEKMLQQLPVHNILTQRGGSPLVDIKIPVPGN